MSERAGHCSSCDMHLPDDPWEDAAREGQVDVAVERVLAAYDKTGWPDPEAMEALRAAQQREGADRPPLPQVDCDCVACAYVRRKQAEPQRREVVGS